MKYLIEISGIVELETKANTDLFISDVDIDYLRKHEDARRLVLESLGKKKCIIERLGAKVKGREMFVKYSDEFEPLEGGKIKWNQIC